MMAYTIIYEHGPDEEGRETWSAYVLELPGCVSGGKTRDECEAMIREAIELHVDLLDLEAAIEKNGGKPLTDWDEEKSTLIGISLLDQHEKSKLP